MNGYDQSCSTAGRFGPLGSSAWTPVSHCHAGKTTQRIQISVLNLHSLYGQTMDDSHLLDMVLSPLGKRRIMRKAYENANEWELYFGDSLNSASSEDVKVQCLLVSGLTQSLEVVTPVIERKKVKQTENPPLFLDSQRMEVTGQTAAWKTGDRQADTENHSLQLAEAQS